jgi:hypothetical protein
MSLRTWWEDRQQRKHDHENEELLKVAEHPQPGAEVGGTDLDELKTDLGTSKMGEMSMDDSRRIE